MASAATVWTMGTNGTTAAAADMAAAPSLLLLLLLLTEVETPAVELPGKRIVDDLAKEGKVAVEDCHIAETAEDEDFACPQSTSCCHTLIMPPEQRRRMGNRKDMTVTRL